MIDSSLERYTAAERPRLADVTTRLQKGGALLGDMRLLVSIWSDELSRMDPMPVISRHLPKATMARVRDTYTRSFRPRFIEGSPPQAWRLARTLEDCSAQIDVIRPFYYWLTARVERPLYDFVTDYVYARSRTADRNIRIDEAVSWLKGLVAASGKTWSPIVLRKVARGMLATLRDFGILEGGTRKGISAGHLPVEAFSVIAFCLHELGVAGRELLKHHDWRLYLLGETGVEHLLLESHQQGWLKFESAGNIVRIEFPQVSFKEFAHDVLG